MNISVLAKDAIDSINEYADMLSAQNKMEHAIRMDSLEFSHQKTLEEYELLDLISPFDSIDDWYEALSFEEQSSWNELFEYYSLDPNGDSVVENGGILTNAVISYLQNY